MTSKKRCAIITCLSNSCNSTSSFYKFPKDIDRARVWLASCGREDLLDKLEKLHNSSYRLCAKHFDEIMYSNDAHKRLHREAVPTVFPALAPLSSGIVTQPTVMKQPIKPYQYTAISEKSSENVSRIGILEDLLTPTQPVEKAETCLTEKVLPTSHKQTQTSQYLSLYTPRKTKLKKRIKKLQNENSYFKQKLRQLEDKMMENSNTDGVIRNSKRKSKFRYCIVPKCPSTTDKCPNKLFIALPTNSDTHNLWLKTIKCDDILLGPKSAKYVCEDHFNLEEDMVNYQYYQLLGKGNVSVKIKPGILPHIFHGEKDYAIVKPTTSREAIKEHEEDTNSEEEMENLESESDEDVLELEAVVTSANKNKRIQDGNKKVGEIVDPSELQTSLKLVAPTQPDVVGVNQQFVMASTTARGIPNKAIDTLPSQSDGFTESGCQQESVVDTSLLSQRHPEITLPDILKFLDAHYPQEGIVMMKQQLLALENNFKGARAQQQGLEHSGRLNVDPLAEENPAKRHKISSDHFDESQYATGETGKKLPSVTVPIHFLGDILRTAMLNLFPSPLPMEENETNLADEVLSPSHRQAQTSQYLSLHAPRKNKQKKSMKKLETENARLRQIVRNLEEKNSRSVLEHISFNSYKQLTYKFCPSRELADFINSQVSENIKQPTGESSTSPGEIESIATRDPLGEDFVKKECEDDNFEELLTEPRLISFDEATESNKYFQEDTKCDTITKIEPYDEIHVKEEPLERDPNPFQSSTFIESSTSTNKPNVTIDCPPSTDSEDEFFQKMAAKVKKLSPKLRAEARVRIWNILGELELRDRLKIESIER